MEDNSVEESAIATDLLLPCAPAAGWLAPAFPRGVAVTSPRCLHVPPPPMGEGSLHLLIGLQTWRGAAPLQLGAILPLLSPGATLSRWLLERISPWILVGWQLLPDSRGWVTGLVIPHHRNLPTKHPILIWRRRFGAKDPYPLRHPRPLATVAGATLKRVWGQCMTKITRNRTHAKALPIFSRALKAT
jgi:hypothetical protein